MNMALLLIDSRAQPEIRQKIDSISIGYLAGDAGVELSLPPCFHLGEWDAALGRKLLHAEVELLAQHVGPVLRFSIGGFFGSAARRAGKLLQYNIKAPPCDPRH
jgi:hypothetical protein